MLRDKQHSRKEWLPPALETVAVDEGSDFGAADIRVPVLLELLDSFDLCSFVCDPAYRRRLNEVLDAFSDEEFDRFERRYARRFTLN